MSTFRNNVHIKQANVLKGYNKSYTWKPHLQNCERRGFSKQQSLPVEAFSLNLIEDYTVAIKEGVVFEIKLDDYEKDTELVEVRWFAKIIKTCGYRVLAQFLGFGSEKQTFWVNMLSDEVHHVGDAQELDQESIHYVYAPPLLLDSMDEKFRTIMGSALMEMENMTCLGKEYDKNKKKMFSSNFKAGQRLELLNYNDSRIVRPARIQNICGRRLNVLVEKKDYDGSWAEHDDDRQLGNKGAEYWIDQESFFIFPVGWALYNGYNLDANEAYRSHTEKIAKALKEGSTPNYLDIDTTPDTFARRVVPEEHWALVKEGQKLELIDPLAQQFQDLKAATILKIMDTPGFVIIGMDGPDVEEDSLPLHIASPFIFPVGYAEKHNLKFVPPSSMPDFEWGPYLAKTGAEKLPVEVFKPEPSQERLDMFKVGSKIEAADMCENQLVCPAMIKEINGRIVNVAFDGWGDDFDELYDIDSHDIFPIGWCEIHGYPLQRPEAKE